MRAWLRCSTSSSACRPRPRPAAAGLAPSADALSGVAVPMQLRTPLGTLSFLSTTMVFGTAVDVTLSELVVESLFPADDAIGLRALAQLSGMRRERAPLRAVRDPGRPVRDRLVCGRRRRRQLPEADLEQTRRRAQRRFGAGSEAPAARRRPAGDRRDRGAALGNAGRSRGVTLDMEGIGVRAPRLRRAPDRAGADPDLRRDRGRAGRPGAGAPLAGAGRNPFAVVVPCHRVLAADDGLAVSLPAAVRSPNGACCSSKVPGGKRTRPVRPRLTGAVNPDLRSALFVLCDAALSRWTGSCASSCRAAWRWP